MPPQLSIIIPVYNRKDLLKITLRSVLAQTYSDWECIVVDDFSTDGTVLVSREFTRLDSRIKYIQNFCSKGAQGARNSGLLSATSDWIIFFDSDDIMHEEFLASVLDGLEKSNADICTCFSTIINRKTGQKEGGFSWVCEGKILCKLLSGETYVDYNAAIIRKKKLFDIGLLDEKCPSFQEWDTHIRLSAIANYHTVQSFLVDYFVGGEDTISIDYKRYIKGYLYLLKKHSKLWKKHSLQSFYRHGLIVFKKTKSLSDKLDKFIVFIQIFMVMPRLLIILIKRRIVRL